MYEDHNKQVLDALGSTGSIGYVHARSTLAIDPTAEMAQKFDARAHRGLIRKYDNKNHKRLLVVDHGTADRFEFEQCIRDCGYGKWTVDYTT